MFKIIKIKAPIKDYEIHFPSGNLVFLNNTTVSVDLAFDNPAQQKINLKNKEFIRTSFNFVYVSSSETGDIELIVADKDFKLGSDFQTNIGVVNTVNSISQVQNVQEINKLEKTENLNIYNIQIAAMTTTQIANNNQNRKSIMIKADNDIVLLNSATQNTDNGFSLSAGSTIVLDRTLASIFAYSTVDTTIEIIEE